MQTLIRLFIPDLLFEQNNFTYVSGNPVMVGYNPGKSIHELKIGPIYQNHV